ncbi:MAG: PAS domain-containing protein, partial [Planctomycetes bacterium]|nr:PAS domain-containing protein [Planctomycetota bacterium]
MIRSRFFWKLYAGLTAVVVVSVAVIGVLLARQITQDSITEIEENLRGRAVVLAELARTALEGGDARDLRGRLRDISAAVPERLTVLGADGAVLADTERDPLAMDSHADRTEVQAARERGSGRAVRYSQTLDTRLMYFALAVKRGGEPVGYVRTSMPLTRIDARLAALRRRVLLGGLAAVAVGLGLAFVFARRVTRPLAAMTRAAEALAGGDTDWRVEVASDDEIGTLGRAFQAMTAALRDRMDTITADRNKALAILGSMVEGVVAVDHEERVVQLNAHAAEILATGGEDCLGQRIWEATRRQEVCRVLGAALRSGRDQRAELRIPAGRGDRHVELRASPLRDAAGRTVGAVVLLHDVTEPRRLETMRRDFVANVSHELKTPLTAIHGLVETLLDDEAMAGETRQRFLAKIRSQADRLLALVTDLLSLSRFESREHRLDRRPVSLREPVAESVERHQAEAERKGVALVLDAPPEPVELLADAEALRQVVDNLLQNAIRYTPHGGRVVVRIRREADHAAIAVEDTGIGIEPRHQARLFERFYRVDTARSRALGGTGLGLSIVKHIAEAHGGDVAVESEPGRGSTFRVRLPLAG